MRDGRSGLLCLLAAMLLAGIAEADVWQGVVGNDRLAITINNLGRLGTLFSNRNAPSCEYPRYSRTEHLYVGGVWVGARAADGTRRVSLSAMDVNGLMEWDDIREFEDHDDPWGAPSFRQLSNDPGDVAYDPLAVAPHQIECTFDDYHLAAGHQPLGLKVRLRALSWDDANYDDFVVLEYTVTNIAATVLRDVYVGFFNDTTVGNTDYTTPFDPVAVNRWNFWDDLNGAWRPGDFVADPGLWMMYEHDDDGDAGHATSWVGCRLLGTEPQVAPFLGRPPVSYNCWQFRGVPQQDDWYPDPEQPGSSLPGRYQLMGNGDFDSGVTPAGDFTTPGNRLALLSTGPFLELAPGDSLRVTFALALGRDGVALRANSRLAKLLYDYGYELPIAGTGAVPGARLELAAPRPNPFNPSTTLRFALPAPGHVRLGIFDVAGRSVRTLVDEELTAGAHETMWDGRDAAGRAVGSGTYTARLECGGTARTVGLALVR